MHIYTHYDIRGWLFLKVYIWDLDSSPGWQPPVLTLCWLDLLAEQPDLISLLFRRQLMEEWVWWRHGTMIDRCILKKNNNNNLGFWQLFIKKIKNEIIYIWKHLTAHMETSRGRVDSRAQLETGVFLRPESWEFKLYPHKHEQSEWICYSNSRVVNVGKLLVSPVHRTSYDIRF